MLIWWFNSYMPRYNLNMPLHKWWRCDKNWSLNNFSNNLSVRRRLNHYIMLYFLRNSLMNFWSWDNNIAFNNFLYKLLFCWRKNSYRLINNTSSNLLLKSARITSRLSYRISSISWRAHLNSILLIYCYL